MTHVLIVEDDGELARLMQRTFESEGMTARIAGSAEEAYDLLTDSVFDCLVVDVNLPGDDGYALCRTLRERSGVPVVFASARIEPDARIRALEEGGDAYLSKPFSLREMLAQAKALMMRPEWRSEADGAVLSVGPFELDRGAKTLGKDGRLIALSPREFQLASVLMSNVGTSLSRDALLVKAWGAFAEVEPQTVSVHMSWLRAKLEDDPSSPATSGRFAAKAIVSTCLMRTVDGKGREAPDVAARRREPCLPCWRLRSRLPSAL
ncbi:response regulator transcription factor [Adlercreutzia murintestinalis]|uniref:response regulator transcription factor n=1 Tax=Adlercreutzia murintestinalis TaxID=2941325 RepID=UPI0020414B16|nr:response regulator transcription factor [Adlercreutzia murintestinalis]